MAKIILVTEKLNPTAVRLAEALRSQQHQVTVVSSRDEEAALPADVSLLRPFEKWSLFEALRLVPVLVGLNPQVVHILLEEDRLNVAQIFLSAVSKALPNCVLTTSVLHIRHGLRLRNPVRYLLQESDVVTCSSVESLGALRGLNVKSPRQGRGLLPPVLDFSEDTESAHHFGPASELQAQLEGKKYVVMPFFETRFDATQPVFRRLLLLAAQRHVVLLGSFTAWSVRDRKRFQAWMNAQGLGSQWTLSGEMSAGDVRRLLASAEAFLIAGLSLSPREITEYFLRGVQAGTTIILDDRESTLHADLWRHGENCWILPKDHLFSSLQALLAKGSLHLAQSLPVELNLQRDLIDAPLNELNRLYNRALSQKHTGG